MFEVLGAISSGMKAAYDYRTDEDYINNRHYKIASNILKEVIDLLEDYK